MNVNMYRNPVVQANLRKLKEFGYHVLEPASGWLACGWTGEGRMPEPEIIAERVAGLVAPKDLRGMRVLVTAGPTEEPLDPVRFLTNRSSGKMGAALARRAADRGADTVLVAGPLKVSIPAAVCHVPVRTALEMYDKVLELAQHADVVIKAAAVADFRPVNAATDKLKKDTMEPVVRLTQNPDILKALGERKRPGQILVGFAAETRDIVDNARRKLESKNLDMLAVNDVSREDAGFDVDTNVVRLLYRAGDDEQLEIMSKDRVADAMLDRVLRLRSASPKERS
jgi:phosphopantothenoylcysteine decarboxylase/phosphopantothenate--cysteine ligase